MQKVLQVLTQFVVSDSIYEEVKNEYYSKITRIIQNSVYQSSKMTTERKK